MWPPHCSCLTGMVLIASESFRASKMEMLPCPGIPKTCLTPAFLRNSMVNWAPLSKKCSAILASRVILIRRRFSGKERTKKERKEPGFLHHTSRMRLGQSSLNGVRARQTMIARGKRRPRRDHSAGSLLVDNRLPCQRPGTPVEAGRKKGKKESAHQRREADAPRGGPRCQDGYLHRRRPAENGRQAGPPPGGCPGLMPLALRRAFRELCLQRSHLSS